MKEGLWVAKRSIQELSQITSHNQFLRCMGTNVPASALHIGSVTKALSQNLQARELPQLRQILGLQVAGLVMARARLSDDESLALIRAEANKVKDEAESTYALACFYSLTEERTAHERIVQILSAPSSPAADVLRVTLLHTAPKVTPEMRAALRSSITAFNVSIRGNANEAIRLGASASVSALILASSGHDVNDIAVIDEGAGLMRGREDWVHTDLLFLLSLWFMRNEPEPLKEAAAILGNEDNGGRSELGSLAILAEAFEGERLRLAAERLLAIKDSQTQVGALKLLRSLGYESRRSAETILSLTESAQFASSAATLEAIETLGITAEVTMAARIAGLAGKSGSAVGAAVTNALVALGHQH
jgi:hypothetical protein